MSDQLRQAVKAINSGDEVTGELLLAQLLKADPRNESALMWLFKISRTYEKRREVVEWALAVNAHSPWAKRGLKILEMEQSGIKARQAAMAAKDSTLNNSTQAEEGVDLAKTTLPPETAAPEIAAAPAIKNSRGRVASNDQAEHAAAYRMERIRPDPEPEARRDLQIALKRQRMMIWVMTAIVTIAIVVLFILFFYFA